MTLHEVRTGADGSKGEAVLISEHITRGESGERVAKKYKLVELYDSMKGEGTQAGVPMTFVRFSHCNLSCSFCDTPYDRVAIELTRDLLLEAIITRQPAWVIFTGGEPCLQLDADLTKHLKGQGIKMAIETNGMVWTDAFWDLDYINISPKGPDNPLHPRLIEAHQKGLKIDEVRYIICGPKDDLYETGVNPKAITISPLMHEPVPLTVGWKSGMGHPSMTGMVNQTSFNRCEYLVKKHRHRNARLSVQVHKFVGVR